MSQTAPGPVIGTSDGAGAAPNVTPQQPRRTVKPWLIAVLSAAAVCLVGLLAMFGLGVLGKESPNPALEALQEANDGVLPELEYYDDGSLKAVHGPITKVAVRTGHDARDAVRDVAPLMGITNVDEDLTFVGVEREDEQAVWWFAVEEYEPPQGGTTGSEQRPDDSGIGIRTDEDGQTTEAVVKPIPGDVEPIDEDDQLIEQSDDHAMDDYLSELDISDYELDYQYKVRSYTIRPNCAWLVGEGIEENAAIGAAVRDFDGDGQDELLVVRWNDGTNLLFEMVEESEGQLDATFMVVDAVDDDYPGAYSDSEWLREGASPLLGVGGLDVVCDEDDGIIVQWWSHTNPVADGHEWALKRYRYEGNDDGFVLIGGAMEAGTGLGPEELEDLISQVESTGTPSTMLQSYRNGDYWGYASEMLADGDSSLDLVVRMTAKTDEGFLYEDVRNAMNAAGTDWSDPMHLGSFTITPGELPSGVDGDEDDDQSESLDVDEYLDEIESQATGKVVLSEVADYDGDGSEEAFVITGTEMGEDYQVEHWRDAELWFVSASGDVSFVSSYDLAVIFNERFSLSAGGSELEFLSIEQTGGGSATISSIYGVRNGEPVECTFDVGSVESARYEPDEDRVVAAQTYFDNGHRHHWYAFEFIESSYRFKSTGELEGYEEY